MRIFGQPLPQSLKNTFASLIIIPSLMLAGCAAEDKKESTASKHEKEAIAVESQRILSITRLVEASARQPELMPEFEKAFQDYVPVDNDLLKSEHCHLVAARTYAFSFVIPAITRQPVITQEILKLFSDNAGDLNPDLIKSCDLALYNRNFVVGRLIESYARIPDSIDTIKETALPVIGTYQDTHDETEEISELEIAGALQVQFRMFNALGRQPEAKQQLEALIADLLPSKNAYQQAQGCLANQARLFAMGAYLYSKSRQPEVFNCDNNDVSVCPEEYIGVLSENKAEGTCQLPYSYTFIF